jgi:hypothetical protein
LFVPGDIAEDFGLASGIFQQIYDIEVNEYGGSVLFDMLGVPKNPYHVMMGVHGSYFGGTDIHNRRADATVKIGASRDHGAKLIIVVAANNAPGACLYETRRKCGGAGFNIDVTFQALVEATGIVGKNFSRVGLVAITSLQ